jgi:dihydroorotate dehydrogenase
MRLRNIEFGKILGGAGVEGFSGEGYWFHRPLRPFGLNFDGMTFVSKTFTLRFNSGQMKLKSDYTPEHFFPDCIAVKFWKGSALNAIGLSNPGLSAYLRTGKLQEHTSPFFISLAALSSDSQWRLDEFREMVEILGQHKEDFRAPFGIQINNDCPNLSQIDNRPSAVINETIKIMEILEDLDVPLMPKFSIATMPHQEAVILNDHPFCDAICVSNTIPFGWDGINWENEWGSKVSPLEFIGGGGLSGKSLLPYVSSWIPCVRDAGFTKPINAGGGILHPSDVDMYKLAGASSVFIASVAILRPWRVRKIIERANNMHWPN